MTQETERIRYLGPFGRVYFEVGNGRFTLERGETYDCPHVEQARKLKDQNPKAFDSGDSIVEDEGGED